jgi:hypothetical protein
MRKKTPNRFFATSLLAATSLAGLSCSETKDVKPSESAPVGSAQATPTPSPAPTAPAGGTVAPAAQLPPPDAGKIATATLSASGIDLAKLPVPAGAKSIFADANSAMYFADGGVEATKAELAKLLTAEGWSPYGSAGDAQYFKRNLVRLTANVGGAATGKTSIQYLAEKIAVDLPAPVDAEKLNYSDTTKQVDFDTQSDAAAVEKYYRELLAKSDWKATTDKPFKNGFKDELIFRNPAKDMLTLQLHEFEGKRRVSLKHQSAAEVAEVERRALAAIEQKKKDAEKPLPKLKLTPPVEATGIERKKNRLTFKLPAGKAKGVVEAWRKELTSAGWKTDEVKLDDKVGGLTFRKEMQFLSVDYIDLFEGEITVTATEVELEP